MAEIKEDEQLTGPQAAPEEAPAETPAEVSAEAPQGGSEDTPEEAPKAPKRRDILLPALTILLILVGLGEAAFWGYFGFTAYAHSLARERYEQQRKALAEEQAAKGVTGGSSYSPNLKVENGTVTWEREEWGYAGSGQAANTSATPHREDGLRLARLPVARIPYLLAETDADGRPPSTQTGETA